MEILKASNKQFSCFAAKDLNFITSEELISTENLRAVPNVSKLGFLVVKNVIDRHFINNARNTYFSLFDQGEYREFNNDWMHLKNHKDEHGCKNHPSITFLKKKAFP